MTDNTTLPKLTNTQWAALGEIAAYHKALRSTDYSIVVLKERGLVDITYQREPGQHYSTRILTLTKDGEALRDAAIDRALGGRRVSKAVEDFAAMARPEAFLRHAAPRTRLIAIRRMAGRIDDATMAELAASPDPDMRAAAAAAATDGQKTTMFESETDAGVIKTSATTGCTPTPNASSHPATPKTSHGWSGTT